jgi:hypothetical protein
VLKNKSLFLENEKICFLIHRTMIAIWQWIGGQSGTAGTAEGTSANFPK